MTTRLAARLGALSLAVCLGIASAQDALQFLLAGATAVQVGTSTFVNPSTAVQVVEGIRQYVEQAGLSSVEELVGAAQVAREVAPRAAPLECAK